MYRHPEYNCSNFEIDEKRIARIEGQSMGQRRPGEVHVRIFQTFVSGTVAASHIFFFQLILGLSRQGQIPSSFSAFKGTIKGSMPRFPILLDFFYRFLAMTTRLKCQAGRNREFKCWSEASPNGAKLYFRLDCPSWRMVGYVHLPDCLFTASCSSILAFWRILVALKPGIVRALFGQS